MIYQGNAAYQIAHDTLFSMLLIIDDICQRHGIAYQLAAGTLLGAVREGDFIAWDQDADIAMLRSDFERFMQVAAQELPAHLFLQHQQSDLLFFSQVCKVRLQNSRRIYATSKVPAQIHQGIALDIFPFDDVKPDTVFGRLHMQICSLLPPLFMVRYIGDIQKLWKNNQGIPMKLAAFCAYQLIRWPSKTSFQSVAHWLSTFYTRRGPCQHITCLVSMPFSSRKRLPRIRQRADFTQTVMVTLRGKQFPAPHNYQQVLSNLYGDYMSAPPAAEQALPMQIELSND